MIVRWLLQSAWLCSLAACATMDRGSPLSPTPGTEGSGPGAPPSTPWLSPQEAALHAARHTVVHASADADSPPGDADARPCLPAPWPLWYAYQERFLARDGRIIDFDEQHHSTSEGQSYALFFALVANDRHAFALILDWTERHLARGDLGRHLPAWRWGQDPLGQWGVLDENPASDADLWLVYTLWQAGIHWQAPRYTRRATQLAKQLVRREVRDLPGLGPMLLPAPSGFELMRQTLWRLNPSYLPIPVLRGLSHSPIAGPWNDLLENTVRMMQESAPQNVVGDWVAYHRDHGFGVDPESGPIGSYDAIRVYLWAALLPQDEPHRATMAKKTSGLLDIYRDHGKIPERLDIRNARVLSAEAPPGFLAVAQAQARAQGDLTLAAELERSLRGRFVDGLYGTPPRYYDQNLILFVEGFLAGRYRFRTDGHLDLPWRDIDRCAAVRGQP